MNRTSFASLAVLVLVAGLASCGTASDEGAETPAQTPVAGEGKADQAARNAEIEPLNTAAGDMIVYEVQARTANACNPATDATCASKLAPQFVYSGDGCDILGDLQALRKSTLDDMILEADAPGREQGITLQYIDDVVGANTVWLMPVFPHNMQYNLPHPCDDLGSPYAVRDYFHVRGTLSDTCVVEGRDEWDDAEPCWGDDSLRTFVKKAHDRGMKVMLDLAFNHLGHEYYFYDYKKAVPVRDRIASGASMWDFDGTYEKDLLYPEILDTTKELPSTAKGVLKDLCGTVPAGTEGIRRYLMWREAFDWEREKMDCEKPATLENQVPGFYLGNNAWDPSARVGDNFTNNWNDVKFLYNNEYNGARQWEFVRTREYAFRVINYYLSQGVDAFRLDHANGLTENEWRYIFRKARYYQQKRGMPTPVFLSESFHDIDSLNRVFDVLTEGYHHDICRGTRDASYLEQKLFVNRSDYLKDLSYVLLNLETHDEGRLLKDYTGFDIWRGATFYSIAAASRGSLMLQVGQEWGEPWDLGFKRSDYLRGRFPTEANWDGRGDKLTALYKAINDARSAPQNVALRKGNYWFPRMDNGKVKDQLFAMVKYMPDCSNTLFTFARLWVDDVEATYSMTPDLAAAICLADGARYRLVDVLTGQDVWATSNPGGRTGKHIRDFGIYVHLDLGTSFQWLRLEQY